MFLVLILLFTDFLCSFGSGVSWKTTIQINHWHPQRNAREILRVTICLWHSELQGLF